MERNVCKDVKGFVKSQIKKGLDLFEIRLGIIISPLDGDKFETVSFIIAGGYGSAVAKINGYSQHLGNTEMTIEDLKDPQVKEFISEKLQRYLQNPIKSVNCWRAGDSSMFKSFTYESLNLEECLNGIYDAVDQFYGRFDKIV